jgi:hypothetical protein
MFEISTTTDQDGLGRRCLAYSVSPNVDEYDEVKGTAHSASPLRLKMTV